MGPEAHKDEFSTFNRGVAGSTPARLIKLLRFARNSKEAERTLGKREVTRSILVAGS